MSIALYGHPFSSYTQQALIALYENRTPFAFRCLAPDTPHHAASWLPLWPLAPFPLPPAGAPPVGGGPFHGLAVEPVDRPGPSPHLDRSDPDPGDRRQLRLLGEACCQRRAEAAAASAEHA